MSRARRLIQRLFPVVVSVGALVTLLRMVDVSAVFDAVTWRVATWLVPALLAYGALTLLLEAVSLRLLVPRARPGFDGWTAARIKCASYLLAIVNYTLGQGALAVLLRRRAGVRLAEAASIVVLIAVIDLLVLLGLALPGALVSGSGAPVLRAGVLAVAGIGFLAALAILRAPGSLGPLERIRSLSAFDALRTTPLSRLARLAALRVVFVSSFIALSACAFYGFGVAPRPGAFIVGMAVVAVVGALPIAVAGLGTSQAAVLYVFRDLAPAPTLLAISLVFTAGLISLRVAMGLFVAREFTREALEETRVQEP